MSGRPARAGRSRYLEGRFSDTRESWVRLSKFEAILFIGQDDDMPPGHDTGDHTDPMRLTFRFPGKKWPMTFNLTSMTGHEIRALREFIVRALDMAEPVCDSLDAYAAKAMEEGDDTYVRVYRPLPEIIIRERRKPAHDPSLQERSDRSEDLGGASPDDRSGDGGSRVADLGSQDLGTQDDEPEADDDPLF